MSGVLKCGLIVLFAQRKLAAATLECLFANMAAVYRGWVAIRITGWGRLHRPIDAHSGWPHGRPTPHPPPPPRRRQRATEHRHHDELSPSSFNLFARDGGKLSNARMAQACKSGDRNCPPAAPATRISLPGALQVTPKSHLPTRICVTKCYPSKFLYMNLVTGNVEPQTSLVAIDCKKS